MRLDFAVVALTLCAPVWTAALDAGLHGSDVSYLAPVEERDNTQQDEKLWKRKGGGGGGGGRGGGGGSSSGTGGSRSGGSSGNSGTGGTARGGSRDSSGGSTKTGSGPPPAYGGGRYYGGGATTPYPAGQRRGSMAPFLLVGAGLAFWPGLWLAGAHMYPYSHPYRFYNESARENQTKPVLCGCADHQPCGCDENNSTEYMSSLLGNGSYNGLNKSVVNVADYQGNSTILINGTLPNGTTAAGGDDDVGTTSAAVRVIAENMGFWPVVAVVLATVFAA
nr:putative glycine-rich protein [Colletotrichum truncatum]KAF6798433.1 putative glycine-rich protein [Colletotrichum truncatum]